MKLKYIDFQWKKGNRDLWGVTFDTRWLTLPKLIETLQNTFKHAIKAGVDVNEATSLHLSLK